MARCYVAAGVTRADVIQITPSFGLFTGGFGFHYGAERLGAMVVPTGAGRTALQLRLMRDLGATVLPAIATYPLRLIEVAREEGFDLGSLRLRVAILGSEMWSDELRTRIERELSLQAFDIIGMTETGGPGLGIDCAARRGHPRVGGPLPRRDRRSGDRRAACRRRGGRAGGLDADPRGPAAGALPHARPHADCVTGPLRVRPDVACVWTVCAAAPTTW